MLQLSRGAGLRLGLQRAYAAARCLPAESRSAAHLAAPRRAPYRSASARVTTCMPLLGLGAPSLRLWCLVCHGNGKYRRGLSRCMGTNGSLARPAGRCAGVASFHKTAMDTHTRRRRRRREEGVNRPFQVYYCDGMNGMKTIIRLLL